ncbi:MAG: phosphotransferase family protein [Chthoniobacteraceae bacterium]
MEGDHDHTYPLEHILEQEFRAAEFQVKPLRGGSDSAGVLHVTARLVTRAGKRRICRFVVKRLPLERAREADVYRRFVSTLPPHVAPRLLGVEYRADECRLYLEEIRPIKTWPWRRVDFAQVVVEELANLHQAGRAYDPSPDWDYDAELTRMSSSLLDAVRLNTVRRLVPDIYCTYPALERLVSALPQIRAELRDRSSGSRTFIHGDVHPGNVTIRGREDEPLPVFLDWGRSRPGSPLEDVSSWLQSLGYWEPQAKAKHDTLLLAYRNACGDSAELTRDFRDAYWLAAACNQLAGAALHHLANVRDDAPPGLKMRAIHAAKDSFRVIRRADACWKN